MPARSGAGYTALAFSNADAGYSVIHMRPSARYRNPAEASILAITSDTLPTRILEPNPPFGVGHRNTMTAANTTTTGTTITRGFMRGGLLPVPDQSSKNRPWVQGATKLKPGPRKNEPMMTSTAQNMSWTVNRETANLRSSGLFDGLRSM